MIRFDAEAFRSINNFAGRSPFLDTVGIFGARWLIAVMFLAVAIRAVIAVRRPESRRVAAVFAAAEARALVAGGLAFVGNWLFSLLVFRPRPFVTLMDVHLIVSKPLTPHSFPSAHSSAAFALAFTMLLVNVPFGLLMLLCACAVAFGRVFVGVHYPLDVVMGLFVGLFWALAVHGAGVRVHDVEFLTRFLKSRFTRRV